jgi:DUF1707 SHOCT-like domain
VAIGPWDPQAAAASGHIRASDADRDRVVDALKAAYVYGLLTREELATRTGQALAARTYADLTAVTAVLAERRPPPAPAVRNPTASNPTASNPTASNPTASNPTASNPTARKRISRKAVALGTSAVVLPPALVAAFLTFYGGFIILFLVTFIGAVVTAVPIAPRRPGPWLP